MKPFRPSFYGFGGLGITEKSQSESALLFLIGLIGILIGVGNESNYHDRAKVF